MGLLLALWTISKATHYVFARDTCVIEEMITHKEDALCRVASHVMPWHCLNGEVHEGIISCIVFSIHFSKPAAASTQGAPRGGSG